MVKNLLRPYHHESSRFEKTMLNVLNQTEFTKSQKMVICKSWWHDLGTCTHVRSYCSYC